MTNILKSILHLIFPKLSYIKEYPLLREKLWNRNSEFHELENQKNSIFNFSEVIITFFQENYRSHYFKIIDHNISFCRILGISENSFFRNDIRISIWDVERNNFGLYSHPLNILYPTVKIEAQINHVDYSGNFLGYNRKISLDEETCCWIFDITPGTINKGIGSLLINQLKILAKKRGCKLIKGELGCADLNEKDHKERLLHFYRKHGFAIKLNEDELAGKIICNS